MRFGIMGAGSIGCFVGGLLVNAGEDVVFVGRESLGAQLAQHGLYLLRVTGERTVVSAGQLHWTTDPASLSDCDVVLVCVKGLATAQVGAELAHHLRPDAVVLSLQNGVANAHTLRAHLGPRAVWPCMVSFNVVRQPEGRFLQGTSGPLVTDVAVSADLVGRFLLAGLPTEQHANMTGVLWGKLLLNLNNALNALVDLPLRAQLMDRALRRVLAAAQEEALAALRAARIRPVVHLPAPPWVLPHLLRLPTWLFARAAARMLAIDPGARSSMWEDLQRGRNTEVDLLNGAVVELGRAHGVATPVNDRIVAAIHAVEQGEDSAPHVEALLGLTG